MRRSSQDIFYCWRYWHVLSLSPNDCETMRLYWYCMNNDVKRLHLRIGFLGLHAETLTIPSVYWSYDSASERLLNGNYTLTKRVNILKSLKRSQLRTMLHRIFIFTTMMIGSMTRSVFWSTGLLGFEKNFLRSPLMYTFRRVKKAPRRPPAAPSTIDGIKVRTCVWIGSTTWKTGATAREVDRPSIQEALHITIETGVQSYV